MISLYTFGRCGIGVVGLGLGGEMEGEEKSGNDGEEKGEMGGGQMEERRGDVKSGAGGCGYEEG